VVDSGILEKSAHYCEWSLLRIDKAIARPDEVQLA
jgi:hypothetical protein